jgi:carbamoyltransferase
VAPSAPDPPRAVSTSSSALAVAALRAAGFTEAGCAARLGRDPLLGTRYFLVRDGRRWSTSGHPIDLLIGLLLAGQEVPILQLDRTLGGDAVAALEAMALIRIAGDNAHSELNLYPVAGTYVATDSPPPHGDINPVSCLYPESYLMTRFLETRRSPGRTLDMCTGSGVQALLAAGADGTVVGADNNPRALVFAEFNRRLNGVGDEVRFLDGDLYEACAGEAPFDRITANPPYVPSTLHAAGSNWFSGGPSGEEILAGVLAGFGGHLAEGGVAHVYAMLIHRGDEPYREKVGRWLGDPGAWDVRIRALPFPFHPPEGVDAELDRAELGLIRVRRHRGAGPAAYEHGPAGDLFPGFMGG